MLCVVIAVVVVVLWYLYTRKEMFDPNATYAYQNNVQPFYLSREAVNLWSTPAKKLCTDRAKAECGKLPYVDRIGCMQQAMIRCEQANAASITTQCVAKIPETICKNKCKFGKECCDSCIGTVRAMGVCSTPAINI